MGDASWDPKTRATVQKIPLLTVRAGPRDKEDWGKRLKEVRDCSDGMPAAAAAAAAGLLVLLSLPHHLPCLQSHVCMCRSCRL